MKKQFSITVPLVQFRVIQHLVPSINLIDCEIANLKLWTSEIKNSNVEFSYIGNEDISANQLTEKFNKEWASLIETVKYRFGQVFDCDITHIPHNPPQ